MEPLKQSYIDPADVYGQELNEIQTAMAEVRFADDCTNNIPAGWTAPSTLPTQRVGAVTLLLHHEIPNGGHTLLDDSCDWRDRYVRGWVAGDAVGGGAGSTMPGGNAFPDSGALAIFDGVKFWGYSGLGAATAAPPVRAAGSGQGEVWNLRTWEAASFNVGTWGVGGSETIIYARTVDGHLYFYNNIGVAVYLWGLITCSGKIGGI